MGKQSFPDAYIGRPRAGNEFRKLPGSQRWQIEHSEAISGLEQSLAASAELPKSNSLLAARSTFTRQLGLGLHYAWDGNRSQAWDLLQASATLAHDTIVQVLPTLTPDGTRGVVEMARDGAAAANLVGQEVLAQQLFGYAARFAAGLVTGEEAHPADPSLVFQLWGYYPLMGAYSLLRLRRLSGFSAFLYELPFPEAKKATPVWQPAEIEQLLTTIETSVAVGRAKREGVIWDNSERYLLPLLRALAGSLRAPDAEAARITAQTALEKYYSMIRNLADFSTIYLLVLDLQKAFPEIFSPVTPPVL